MTSTATKDADVSVVLVAYNRAQHIRRTLDCIANQTYTNFDVLICDDCSTDDTESVCREYVDLDPRFRYIKNKQNLRMPGNLNSGITRTGGEFVAIMHDGDIYAPNTLERWREALLEHPTAGFVFNRYEHLKPDGSTWFISAPRPRLMTGSDFLTWCFADRELQCPVWGTVMARRSVLEKMGLFDPHHSFWSDIDMWFRIAEKYDVAHVPEVLIQLPSRKAMPHLFDRLNLGAHRHMFEIYWRAKFRRHRSHPLTAALELSKQTFGFGMALSGRAYRRALAAAWPMLPERQAETSGIQHQGPSTV